ncbi:MAG TPA: hypothetical protein VI251_05915, partial [Pseudolabrys sp.]
SVSSLPGVSNFFRRPPTSVIVPVTVLNALETRSPNVRGLVLRAFFRFLMPFLTPFLAAVFTRVLTRVVLRFATVFFAFAFFFDRFAIASPRHFHALQSSSIGGGVIRRQG